MAAEEDVDVHPEMVKLPTIPSWMIMRGRKTTNDLRVEPSTNAAAVTMIIVKKTCISHC